MMMKYIMLPLALYGGCVAAQTADPYSGSVVISGKIQDNTCTISTDTTNLNVPLGNVSSKQFRQAGDSSQKQSFEIDLENCGEASSGVSVTFSGNVDSNNSSLLALNPDAGSASGVGVAILDANSTLIPINNGSKPYLLDPNKKDNILQFYAQYLATGTSVTAGSADATATFTLTYQ